MITTANSQDKDILTSYLTVASYEMDSFGHVNNAVFLNYLEKARCDFMIAKGLAFKDFFTWDRYPVVVRAHVEYKFPAQADDHLLIKGWIRLHTATSFTLQYEITNQDNGKLVLTGETVHVFVDGKNHPCRIPSEFSRKFLPTKKD